MAEEFKTPNGKVLEAHVPAGIPLYKVRFTSGGQLPKELSGSYLDRVQAEQAIRMYLSNCVEDKAPSKAPAKRAAASKKTTKASK